MSLCTFKLRTTGNIMGNICPHKVRLTAEWADATTAYARNLRLLSREDRKIPSQYSDELRQTTEEARHQAERLRKILDLHILSHDC
jgi:hypothetical protein